VDIVVSGRNVEVPDHYRLHVAEKLSKIERFDHKVIRIDVELHHERNRRQSSACQHVEITCKSRGPVVRSEACAADFYAALDAAVGKLEARLRRAADRRRVHYGQRRVKSVLDATTEAHIRESEQSVATSLDEQDAVIAEPQAYDEPAMDVEAQVDMLGRVVRQKEHDAKPMSVDQALHEMELIGHDFYLFADAESGLPSVVYRRKGYAYGVIRLKTPVIAAPSEDHAAPAMAAPAARMPSAAESIPAQSRAFAART
jgi:ribosomal subunit interface protein